MRYLNKIFLAVSILSIFFICGPMDAECDETQNFWMVFRNSVISNDIDNIVCLTNFPFVVNGYLDEDPKQKIGKELFVQIFPRLVNSDAGVSYIPTPMKQVIANTESLDISNVQNDKYFRVGTFRFEKISGKWMFTEAYYGD